MAFITPSDQTCFMEVESKESFIRCGMVGTTTLFQKKILEYSVSFSGEMNLL
jgi:hypothetical protein